MKLLEKFMLFAGALFGLYESLLWAYVFYVQSRSPTLSVTLHSISRVDWTLDVFILALAILFTLQAVLLSIHELFRGDEND